jgi:pentatricopeptide repeat protein
MSVEELVKVCASLPPDASAVATVSSALAYLDSRAMAALMKELAKCHALPRAMELFDWLRSQPAEHELHALCDVYTFTTAISLMGSSQQLRRALELVGEMRARGLQANVHTYSALMNVCIKVGGCGARAELRGGSGLMHQAGLTTHTLTTVVPPPPLPALHSVTRATSRSTCLARCGRTRSAPTW